MKNKVSPSILVGGQPCKARWRSEAEEKNMFGRAIRQAGLWSSWETQ